MRLEGLSLLLLLLEVFNQYTYLRNILNINLFNAYHWFSKACWSIIDNFLYKCMYVLI